MSCRQKFLSFATSGIRFTQMVTVPKTNKTRKLVPSCLFHKHLLNIPKSPVQTRTFCSKTTDTGIDSDKRDEDKKRRKRPLTLGDRYEYFDEAKPFRILDAHELEAEGKVSWETFEETEGESSQSERFHGISLQRGKDGIFDIEEFVEILRNENLKDICVIKIPEHIQYCDYMVITTVKSGRQRAGVAEFLRQVAKRKKAPKDPFPIIEGTHKESWIAMDLGNIVLHLFDQETREQYDLETLWTVGSQFDSPRHTIQSEYEQFLHEIESESPLPTVPPIQTSAERTDVPITSRF